METIINSSGFAQITMGLEARYTKKPIMSEKVLARLSALQDELYSKTGVMLSANCWESLIICGGQHEPHLNLRIINYPKKRIEDRLNDKEFKSHVQWLAESLMKEFNQNRVVIAFHDELRMLQQSDETDTRIHNKSEK